MRQIAFQRRPDARYHSEVFRLAIAPVEPGEDADNLSVALCAERCVIGKEIVIRDAGMVRIMYQHRCLQIDWDVAPRVLE